MLQAVRVLIPWSSFVLITLVLTACRAAPEMPPWFDGLHRTPIRTMLVDGHRIAYLDQGAGPPVIFLHGFGGSMWQWEYQLSLDDDHRVIVLDFLGAGLSDKPNLAYTPDDLIAFLTAFMDALHVQRASLVGNSMGAGIAIGMALAHPERVERLVLISGLPDHVRERLTSPLMHRAVDNWLPIWMIEFGNRFSGRGVTRRVLSEMVYDQALLTPLVIERSHRNRTRSGMLRPVLTMVKNLPLWEQGFARRLSEITQPTLILWGMQDKVFPPTVGETMREMIPGSRLELIPDSGHLPMWERPHLVNPLLKRFLTP